MGIHDRDYYQDAQGPARHMTGHAGRGGGGGGLMGTPRLWSVNTWLIVICVAVFVIDGFLPLKIVEVGRYYTHNQQTDTWKQLTASPLRANQGLGEELTLTTKWQGLHDAKVELPDGTIEVRSIGGYAVVPTGQPDREPVGLAEGLPMRPLAQWFYFSSAKVFGNAQIWRLIGFQFLHGSMAHLLFNMLALFFFGPLVERHLGRKRYLAFYLLCGLFGALLFMALNLGGYIVSDVIESSVAIPGLLFSSPGTPLIGASAGVLGVLMAGAFIVPRARVLLFFIIPMRLSTLAYVLVGIALLQIFRNGTNAGGEAAHLGGAIAGFVLIRRPHWLHGMFDIAGRVDPTSKHFALRGAKGPPGGPGRPGRPGRPSGGGATGAPSDEAIDRILDKISQKGLHSLSEKEKKKLQSASRKPREQR